MDLRSWLDLQPSGAVTNFARELGVSRVYLSQLAGRQDGRVPSAELAVQIWRKTHGEVSREQLRPDDYWLIWPDLPAPAAQAQEAAHG